jgi:glycosyltransferase involved in cell wall biosynthesis
VVPNGADPDAYIGLPPYRPSGDRVMVGFVGFVRPWHGLDRLVAAMAAHQGGPIVELLVVGDGPARAALEAQAIELGIATRVRFTGVVERAAVPALVANFDVALQPSAVDYASPLKIFDYMAGGRPIVAPDQPNIREILSNELTALLFPPGDHAAMWQAVLRLAADPELRARLGGAARAEILRRDYTWHANARRITGWASADGARRPQRPPETVRIEPVT